MASTGSAAGLNPFRFSSEVWDGALGLVYYNWRHYNPLDGRFISRDPIGEQGGLNLYGFVGNDPVNNVDAFGQITWPSGMNDNSWSLITTQSGSFVAKHKTEMHLDSVIVQYTLGKSLYQETLGKLTVTVGLDLSRGKRFDPRPGPDGKPREWLAESPRDGNVNATARYGAYILLEIENVNNKTLSCFCNCKTPRIRWSQFKIMQTQNKNDNHNNGYFYDPSPFVNYLEDYPGGYNPTQDRHNGNFESSAYCDCNGTRGKQIAKFYWATRWFNQAGTLYWWPFVENVSVGE
jgi:RHS repeat-associated protein